MLCKPYALIMDVGADTMLGKLQLSQKIHPSNRSLDWEPNLVTIPIIGPGQAHKQVAPK